MSPNYQLLESAVTILYHSSYVSPTYYAALQMKNSTRSTSAINPDTINACPTINYGHYASFPDTFCIYPRQCYKPSASVINTVYTYKVVMKWDTNVDKGNVRMHCSYSI